MTAAILLAVAGCQKPAAQAPPPAAANTFAALDQVTRSGTKPPVLVIPGPMAFSGPNFMVKGRTQPAAVVFINGEEVSVDGDGHFHKLVSATHVGEFKITIIATTSTGTTKIVRTLHVEA